MRYRLSVTAAVTIAVVATLLVPALTTSATASDNLGVRLSNTAKGKILVTWEAAGGRDITTYVVETSTTRGMDVEVKRYSTGPDTRSLEVPHTIAVTRASGDFTFVRVRVHRSNGNKGSSPVKWIMPTPIPPPAATSKVALATFNVRIWGVKSRQNPAPDWKVRRKRIASTIVRSGAGVVMLQEASGSPAMGIAGRKWQFQDLLRRLPTRFNLTSAEPYRNRKDKIVGSQGSRIVYDSLKYKLLSRGYLQMPESRLELVRWIPWAVLKDRRTGQQFYALSVHFKSGDDRRGSTRIFRMRQQQTRFVIAHAKKMAATGRAVYLGGDFNSTNNTVPHNGVHRLLVRAGYYDAFATTRRTNGQYPTTSGFDFPVRAMPFRRDYLMSLGAPAGSYSFTNHVYQSKSKAASDHFMQSGVMPLQVGPYTRVVRPGFPSRG